MCRFSLCVVLYLLVSTQRIFVGGHLLHLSSVKVQNNGFLEDDLLLELRCDDFVISLASLEEIQTSDVGHVLFEPPVLVKDSFLPGDTLFCTLSNDVSMHNQAFGFPFPFPFSPRRRQPRPTYQPPYYRPPVTPAAPVTQVPATIPPPPPAAPRFRTYLPPLHTDFTTHFLLGPLNVTVTFTIGLASPPPQHPLHA